MTKANEIIELLNSEFPVELRAVWDSTDGYLEGDKDKEVKRIGVSLELGPRFNSEQFDMLILHHPPKFGTEKHVTNPFYSKLINEPVIYALHSRIDVKGKMNEAIAKRIFDEFKTEKVLDDGTLIISVSDLAFSGLVDLVKNKLGKNVLKVLEKKPNVRKIAIHGGEGFTKHHVDKAAQENVDAYLGGDLNHHLAEAAFFHDLSLIDIDHTTEQEGMKQVCKDLQSKFPDCEFVFVEQKPFWEMR